jgi:hypothetical protein
MNVDKSNYESIVERKNYQHNIEKRVVTVARNKYNKYKMYRKKLNIIH